jgi:hypothetical protein
MKIRDDLEGVVHVRTLGGVVVLKAGDTVPDGVEVGDHLTGKAAPAKESEDAGVKPRRGRPARPATTD